MVGNCVVLMSDGKEKECRDIYIGEKVRTPFPELSEITSIQIGNEERGIRIVTDRGQRITLSELHVLLTRKGPKLVKDLLPGDLLVSDNWGESQIAHIYVDPIYEKSYRFETDKASWIFVNGLAVGDVSLEADLLRQDCPA